MRMLRTGVRAAAASVVAVLLLTVPAIGAVPVLTTKAAEFNPAATDTYIAWNGFAHRHYVVYAKQFGGSRFRVNPTGTDGYVGSIEGTTLIYQQWNPSKGTRTSSRTTSWRRRRPRSASRSAPAAGTTTPPGRATG